MVTLVGGYILTFEQVARFATTNGLRFREPILACIAVNHYFKTKGIPMPELKAVRWRDGLEKSTRIMMAIRITDSEPEFQFEEQERDMFFKNLLLRYQGLEGVDLKFVTVVDPFSGRTK